MAFPLLKLMDLTGPQGSPTEITIEVFLPSGDRFVSHGEFDSKCRLEGRTLFVFDDQTFAGFTSETQIHLGLRGPGNQALADQVIEATDVNSPNKRYIDFPVNGIIGGPAYTLGCRVLSGN